jgi:phenylalanyl-tRNA synthetase alpha chain
MIEHLTKVKKEVAEFIISDSASLENFRLKFLVKKGIISGLMDDFRNLPPEEKKDIGKLINAMKNEAEEKFNEFKNSFFDSEENLDDVLDKTLPIHSISVGGIHPITLVINDITKIFNKIGFTVADGPEIEDDFHNFSSLNFADDHPARDMQDTFFINENYTLRTHTSSVQIRVMEREKPPIRVLCPGRVYRNEAVSARSNCFFHQIEGLYVDENVSFADLKQTLYFFVKEFFGKDLPIRFRASYFPFTEPSAEMDVYLGTETEEDKRLTKGTGWLEILGCGMVDPNVLENVGIDSTKYTGYAFGLGIDRIAMLKYGIKDIRMMFDNDIRFLSQFAAF